MRFISLFAGIGGFDLALERLGHECVFSNDIDKYTKITYDRHFKTKQTRQDIRTIDVNSLPKFDLLCGGFPCQAFSIAGKRKGFSDTRGTLFYEICRIAAARKPRLLLLENVKGLLSHDNGKTFYTIIESLDELGYDVQWQVLNSKNFGVPQNRERVFIIGHIRGTSRPKVFPFQFSDSDTIPGNTKKEEQIADTITTRYAGRNGRGTHISVGTLRTFKNSSGFREMKSGLSPTITARGRSDGNGQPVIGIVRSKNEFIEKSIANTLDANYYKGLDAHQQRTGIAQGMTIRRLTPTECERLQGFPDGWTEGVSDTQRYKQLGNAVTVNVIYEIAKKI